MLFFSRVGFNEKIAYGGQLKVMHTLLAILHFTSAVFGCYHHASRGIAQCAAAHKFENSRPAEVEQSRLARPEN